MIKLKFYLKYLSIYDNHLIQYLEKEYIFYITTQQGSRKKARLICCSEVSVKSKFLPIISNLIAPRCRISAEKMKHP